MLRVIASSLGLAAATLLTPSPLRAAECRVLNLPRFDAKPMAERSWPGDHGHDLGRAGVTWMGRFDRNANYAELRASYDAEGLALSLNVADLFVWWVLGDGVQWNGQLLGDPTAWDAIEIAIDPAPRDDGQPSDDALRVLVAAYPYNDPVQFPDSALPHLATRTWIAGADGWTAIDDAVAAGRPWYHAHGSSWNADPGPSDNTTEFDNGSTWDLFVPWTALGSELEPDSGAVLKLAVRVHDLDDPRDGDTTMDPPPSQRGSSQTGPGESHAWPAWVELDDTGTWGTLVMHQAPYQPPAVVEEHETVLDPDSVPVRDVTVGGHAFIEQRWLDGGGAPQDYAWETCMDTRFGAAHDLFVHPEARPIHLCFFSRTLLSWDLVAAIPAGEVVTGAELRMFHFGGDTDEDPGDPSFEVQTSRIQAHRLEGAWTDLPLEQGVTWNTAPVAAENVGYGEVTPEIPAGSNGKTVSFDLTPMVARAVARGEPLSLALYGADWTANTGKYFVSSEGGWQPSDRPTLIVRHGPPTADAKLPDPDACTIGVAATLFDPPGTGAPTEPTPPPEGGSDSGGSDGSAGSGASEGGDAGDTADAGSGGADGATAAGAQDESTPGGSGCGCASAPLHRRATGLFASALLLAARRRRWRPAPARMAP